MKKYIIGITTGRSGSMSFAEFLNQQPGVNFSHELCGLAFWPIFDTYPRALSVLQSRPGEVVGDISPMWIMYLDRIVRDVGRDNIKIIHLDRGNPQQVATSFDSYKRYEKTPYNGAFGKYPVMERKYSRQAIDRSVDLVLWLIDCAEKQFGDIMAHVMMKDLNSKSMQESLLDWLEIPTDGRIYGMPRKNLRVELVKKFRAGLPPIKIDPDHNNYDIGGDNDPYK
jgi:hypothetical protein